MNDFIIHPVTRQALEEYLTQPTQATVLIGPNGIGKGTLLQHIAGQLLDEQVIDLSDHPQVINLGGDDSLGIDEIRRIQRFLTLKPADADKPRRIIIIEHAERLTPEAQNALLKSIEEPPSETYFAFSAASSTALLPTVMSRLQTIAVMPPAEAELTAHFNAQGHSSQDIQRAILLSGGLPGAAFSLLGNDSEHPLLAAVQTARQLLQASRFERVAQVDKLSKDREAAIQVCDVLAQMASVSLHRAEIETAQVQRWQTVLEQSLRTAEVLRRSGQVKLALMSMTLKI